MAAQPLETVVLPRVSGRHRDRALASARKCRAIQLKLQGLTYQQIADQLGYTSHASAWLHRVYLNVQQQGRRDPTTAVNETIGKARSTAAAFISKARDAGLLPPPKC